MKGRENLRKQVKILPREKNSTGKGQRKENMTEDKIQKKQRELQQLLKKIGDFMEKAPAGSLKIQRRAGRIYYYHQYQDEKTSMHKKKYILRKDENLARNLAQKGYYAKIKPIIERQIDALARFEKEYRKYELDDEFEKLVEERRKLIHPISMSTKMKIEQWHNEEYDTNQKYAEGLIFETENGEMVRSKSEMIIANALLHSSHILYKYERPIEIFIHGKASVFYPDFTTLNIDTGEQKYWEHAGRMDDPNYANDFVKKINIYAENNIVLGKDLIVTYETRDNPLSMRTVKAMLFLLEE